MMRVDYFLVMAALLFSIGCVGVLVRRNIIVILMSIELMLNAVNLTFVAFSHELRSMTGHVFALFVITVAACEAAVGLAIVLALFRRRQTTDVDDVSLLRW
ncbi:MAG TPA: NADH-quinone oxidoreductase subunit NuoK [Candidatus Polarisedimenticolia bacterium]|nr:NADH-quinone oxidoreductase subunit NuoK [Candidatus Polarisedimenticolia bacterium]